MFTLDGIVPWGRSFDEYCRMFALDLSDRAIRILGCGDGPASFNAEATKRGLSVVSCDPVYRWQSAQIEARIAATYDAILDETRRNADAFVWDAIRTVDELGGLRMAAMRTFLDDYDQGKVQGRYVEAELPDLPFDTGSFDLSISSHLLFLYSDHLDEAFHQASIRELSRVAREVRIFPLLTLAGMPSPYVGSCARALERDGYVVTLERVPYEFQRGGNRMMRVRMVDGR